MSVRSTLRTWGPGLAVAVALALVQLLWVANDTSGLLNDDRNLYRAAACLSASLGTEHSGAECLGQTPYPPLLPSWTALHFGLLRPTVQVATASLWPFWLLLGLASYRLVQRRAGALAGVAAALLAGLLAVHSHLRAFYFGEIPLAAAALGALACWDASDGLRKRWPSLGLGLCLGVGLMCKWSFGFFLGPPMALALALVLQRALRGKHGLGPAATAVAATASVAAGLGGWLGPGVLVGVGLLAGAAGWLAWLAWRRPELLAEHGRARLVGAGLVVLVVASTAGPWYLAHAGSMQAFLSSNLEMQYAGERLGLAQTWVYYPIVAWFRLPSPVVPLLLLALIRSLRPGGGGHGGWAFWVLLSGTLILAALPYRADRYLLPAIPALAVPALLALAGWRHALRAVSIVIIAWAMVFHLGWLPALRGQDLRSRLPRALDDVAPFGFPGNEWAGIQLGMDLIRESPWTFQLIAHAPKPFGEPWAAILDWTAQRAPQGCPGLLLVHCDGPCEWKLLEDMQYAWAPFDRGGVAQLEGAAEPQPLLDRARDLAPFDPSRDGWPANLGLVSIAPPDRAASRSQTYRSLGLETIELSVAPSGGVQLWAAAEPGRAAGCPGSHTGPPGPAPTGAAP
jgi:hypothetical protein